MKNSILDIITYNSALSGSVLAKPLVYNSLFRENYLENLELSGLCHIVKSFLMVCSFD